MSRDSCKVDVVTEEYGLDGGARYDSIDEWLLARWLGEDGRKAEGYRTVTHEVNKRLVKRVYDEHGRDAMGARLDGDYEALSGDDVVRKREVVEDVASDGIDAERLRSSLVSWGTVRIHLTECLGERKEPPEATTDWERESVERARDHARKTVEKAVSALSSKGRIERAVEADVEMPILLSCPECPTRTPLEEALERGYACREHLANSNE